LVKNIHSVFFKTIPHRPKAIATIMMTLSECDVKTDLVGGQQDQGTFPSDASGSVVAPEGGSMAGFVDEYLQATFG
jgi:hypothetical protein